MEDYVYTSVAKPPSTQAAAAHEQMGWVCVNGVVGGQTCGSQGETPPPPRVDMASSMAPMAAL